MPISQKSHLYWKKFLKPIKTKTLNILNCIDHAEVTYALNILRLKIFHLSERKSFKSEFYRYTANVMKLHVSRPKKMALIRAKEIDFFLSIKV